MKIIAQTKGGFILEATEDETARLCGYYASHTTGNLLKIGADIGVHAMFDRAHEINCKQQELTRTKQLLRAVADLLEPVDIIVLTEPTHD